jgi:hypothetical protein
MASEIIWLAINFPLDIPELTFGVLAVAFGDWYTGSGKTTAREVKSSISS